jgi:ribonucleotide reductase alpha subunit
MGGVMRKTSVELVSNDDALEVPYQPASLDVWDKKYRLKKKDGAPIDVTIDDTYQRVARSLAEVEATDSCATTRHSYSRLEIVSQQCHTLPIPECPL